MNQFENGFLERMRARAARGDKPLKYIKTIPASTSQNICLFEKSDILKDAEASTVKGSGF